MNKGKIVQVIGPVVDVEFTEKLPGIYNAVKVEYDLGGEKVSLTLEVQQHLGDNWVRAVAMSTTEGLKRGVLPYRLVRSSKGYSYYERIDDKMRG
jgi:F-type H+-transporting ATPase subunit beta